MAVNMGKMPMLRRRPEVLRAQTKTIGALRMTRERYVVILKPAPPLSS